MRTGSRFGAALLALALVLGGAVRGRTQETGDAALGDRVRALEDELALLRRKLEVREEEDTSRAATAAVVSADRSGFQIQSPDRSSFRLRLRGYTHADARGLASSDDESGVKESFTLRRARILIEGTLLENIDFRIMPDWGGGSATLQDAYTNLRYSPLAQLQFGKFKTPFGLERLQSATAMTFIERGFPTQLAPNRDVGVMFHGDVREGLLQYQLAWVNGVTDGSSADVDADSTKDLVARAFAQPFLQTTLEPLQGLGLGFAGSLGQQDRAVTTYKSGAQDTFFRYAAGVSEDGDRVRLGPQATWYWGPFGSLLEWTRSRTDLKSATATLEADVEAWQAAASWVLTGESASFRGVVPRDSFRPSAGNWGAFEVALRFHHWEIDDDVFDAGFASRDSSASEADAWTLGLNWYLNSFVKLALNYERTSFDDGAAGGTDRSTEELVLTRLQLSY